MERTPGKGHPREEKILVTVRVRPLNSREIAHNDTSAWVCTDDRTVVFQQGGGSGLPDRSPQAKSYTFDHVFGPESATDQVYEEGAKDVALSALTGLNATIFAYGQTSSGKTYTMKGIMEKAIIDIYEHIRQHCDRDFALKVSAMEIYNEVVKDLLRSDSGPLRLLDDPEKGTIVEKLAEDIVRDSNHLKQALATCEAQRQVGETCLNDTSSRSHLIIRLTVESAPRGAKEGSLVNTLVASLNFVDLAGSERVSQTMAEGTRLKEGCHINRSLLTLTTVIRKLSSGGGKGKNGHLPYRDSKLTRILQNSLGGNARTAIICTMSPASSHVEQSRNTLFFATRAKEVTNAAHVNVVVSDKAMVKQLQKEVARLEAELRGPTNGAPPPHCPSDVEALLSEKEAEIAKLKRQVGELQQERDLLQSRLDEFLKKAEEDEESKRQISPVKAETPPLLSGFPSMDGKKPERLRVLIDRETQEEEEIMRGSTPKPRSPSTRLRESINRQSAVRQSTPVSHLLLQEIRKLERQQDELGVNAARAWGTLQKEVECLRLAQAGMNMEAASTLSKVQQEIQNMHQKPIVSDRDGGGEGNNEEDSVTVTRNQRGSLREEIRRLQASGGDGKSDADATIATLEAQLEHIQKSLDNLVLRPCAHPESTTVQRRSSSANPLASLENNSNNYQFCPEMAIYDNSLGSPRTPQRTFAFDKDENEPPPYTPSSLSNGNGFHPSAKTQKNHTDVVIGGMGGDTTPNECTPPSHRRNNSVDIKKMQNMFKTAAEENIRSIRAYVTELKEKVAKLQYQKQLLVCQVLELESNRNDVEEEDEEDDETQMEEEESTVILQSPSNWQALFQEQRKEIIDLWDVCFVSIVHRSQFYLLFKGDRNDAIYMEVELRRLHWLQEHLAENLEEGQSTTNLASSIRALKREREFLARQMRTRVTPEEREEIFQRWKIPLDVKQRKMQLAQRLWTDPHDPEHIQDSAEVVARLVGFWEPSTGGVSKEMFELSFATGMSPSPCSTNKPQLQPWLSGLNSIATRFLNL